MLDLHLRWPKSCLTALSVKTDQYTSRPHAQSLGVFGDFGVVAVRCAMCEREK